MEMTSKKLFIPSLLINKESQQIAGFSYLLNFGLRSLQVLSQTSINAAIA